MSFKRLMCPTCRGRRHDVEVCCENCEGTGWDPNEDNPFAQCHSCHGEGTVVEEDCPTCGGTGQSDDPDT